MIAVVRINGMVHVPEIIENALQRLRLRRKYAAVIIKDTQENRKLLRAVRNHVAYGTVTKDTLAKLIESRGKPLKAGEKIDLKKAAAEADKKSLEELGLKPFFRLHPPRGGIESKKHFGVGKGVLGDNKEKINDLIGRML